MNDIWRIPSRVDAFAGPPDPRTAPEPEIDARFSILGRGEGWAVVSKSGNIPCHPSGRYRRNTLETLLRETAGFQQVHFVSRLDRETSGCVLVATDPQTAGVLGKSLMARRIAKTYFCVVRGQWRRPCDSAGLFSARGWICPAGDDIVRKYRIFIPASTDSSDSASPQFEKLPSGAQEAETVFRALPWTSLGSDAKEAATLDAACLVALECRPVTGRTHQIRATLRALGMEVVGDKLYGPDRAIYGRMCDGRMTPADVAALKIKRQALHAWRIRFRDPSTWSDIQLEAPPDDLLLEIRRAFS